jgi:hypothetical protein
MKSFTTWIEEFEGSPDNIHFTIALSNYGLSAEQITQARKVFDDDDIPILWWLIDKIKLDQKDAQAVIEILEKDWYDNLDRTTRATPQIEESSHYDDLVADYGFSEDEIRTASDILDDRGEGALEDWLESLKRGLSYGNIRAIVRALKSSKDHRDGFSDQMQYDWPQRGY